MSDPRRPHPLVIVIVIAAIAAAITLAACGDAPRASRPGTAAVATRLDAALARGVQRTGTPGATAAVVDHGRLIWTGAAGRARAGRGGAMHARSLFSIASATKTVTAILAMKLTDGGRLALDEPIEAALPGLPGAGRITPRMLLDHSSGLSDYFADGALAQITRRHPYHGWTRGQVLAHVDRLSFPPGSRHSYSNSGYVALGGVLERVSGDGIEALFQRLIAGPLRLRHSTFRYGAAPQAELAHPIVVERRRLRDRFGARAKVPTDYWGATWTDGGLATTAADLARIGNALYLGRLLPRSVVASMLPPHPGGWGLGTFDLRALGARWVGHDGAYGGYQTENWTDRDRRVTVVAFANRAGPRTVAAPIWRQVARAYGADNRPPLKIGARPRKRVSRRAPPACSITRPSVTLLESTRRQPARTRSC
jgi:D-alanyl-D-alanine carboxypeptidase